MRDLEQELVDTLARGYDSDGQPRAGFFNLTQRMENEAEDQLDVDTTVLDFLMHKAISAAFEWYAKPDKYDSDLPNALITMTAGELHSENWGPQALTLQNGDRSFPKSTRVQGSVAWWPSVPGSCNSFFC